MIRTILVLRGLPIDSVPCSHVIQVSPPGYISVREPSHGYRKRCIYASLHHLSGTHFEARAHVEAYCMNSPMGNYYYPA